MKFILISPKNRTVWNFRGDLVKEFVKKGYEVVVTGPDQTDVEKIEGLGARFVEIPMNKTGTSVIGDLKYCSALLRLFRKERPDITLGYTVKPVIYGAIAAKLAGLPVAHQLRLVEQPRRLQVVLLDAQSSRIETGEVVCRSGVRHNLQGAGVGLGRRVVVLCVKRHLPQDEERPHGLHGRHRLVLACHALGVLARPMSHVV